MRASLYLSLLAMGVGALAAPITPQPATLESSDTSSPIASLVYKHHSAAGFKKDPDYYYPDFELPLFPRYGDPDKRKRDVEDGETPQNNKPGSDGDGLAVAGLKLDIPNDVYVYGRGYHLNGLVEGLAKGSGGPVEVKPGETPSEVERRSYWAEYMPDCADEGACRPVVQHDDDEESPETDK